MASDPRLAALPAVRKLAEEQWRPFPGWRHTHEVSDHGRVRAHARTVFDLRGRPRLLPARYLALSPVFGYPTVMFHFERRAERVRVHRAVLRAFVGEPADGQIARHLDGNPSNSYVGNLAWGTPTENMEDARRHGTLCVGERNAHAVLDDSSVRAIMGAFIAGATPSDLAAQYAVATATVCDVLRGDGWAHIDPPPGIVAHREMIARGEHWTTNRPHRIARGSQSASATHPGAYRGERNGRARLTEDNVIAIRADAGADPATLAARYGVDERTIKHVIARTSWKHIATLGSNHE